MDNREHIDSLPNDSVDEALAAIEDLSDILASCLRYDAANHRKSRQSFGARDKARDEISGVNTRVSGNVVAQIARRSSMAGSVQKSFIQLRRSSLLLRAGRRGLRRLL